MCIVELFKKKIYIHKEQRLVFNWNSFYQREEEF
jgi:hypothetical protein